MGEDTLRCRIQYINDLDPFVSTNNREPLKPLVYSLALHRPIGDQIPDIIRQLRAPHKSGDAALQVSPSASGDLGSYLDSDLTLYEQPDELQILQADP
uniref:FHOD1 N-terminal GTPase-binding domain-containing protein n=1 Tax=Acrobeloides nanus TaxID=290746 RepID=A0A914CXA7_9BILA